MFTAEDLVRAERGDISELMTTSFSETHTTEELLPAQSEEEKDDEEEEEREFQNRPYPPRVGTNCVCIMLGLSHWAVFFPPNIAFPPCRYRLAIE